MTKILLLDKDGTLVNPLSGDKFINQPWDQTVISGIGEAVAALVDAEGWLPVIVSNQGGIAAGYKSLESAIAEMAFCLNLLPDIKEAFFCPDFEGRECWRVWGDCSEECRIKYENEVITVPYGTDAASADGYKTALADPEMCFRKPGAGMLRLAMSLHGASEALMVGDRPEDQGAADAAGVAFRWAEAFRW